MCQENLKPYTLGVIIKLSPAASDQVRTPTKTDSNLTVEFGLWEWAVIMESMPEKTRYWKKLVLKQKKKNTENISDGV